MKLRPTKREYNILNNLKVATSQQTYTKAIMIAAKAYPEMRKELANAREEYAKLMSELRQYDQATGFILDGLEVLRRLHKEFDE